MEIFMQENDRLWAQHDRFWNMILSFRTPHHLENYFCFNTSWYKFNLLWCSRVIVSVVTHAFVLASQNFQQKPVNTDFINLLNTEQRNSNEKYEHFSRSAHLYWICLSLSRHVWWKQCIILGFPEWRAVILCRERGVYYAAGSHYLVALPFV